MLPSPAGARSVRKLVTLIERRRVLISALVFVGLIAANLLAHHRPHDVLNPVDPWSVAGTLMVLAGLAIRSWAAGVLIKTTSLTMTGPYRLIRNPLYLGSFLMMFGFCTIVGDPLNVVAIVALILLVYIIKLRQEERTLATRFGAAWSDYARTTPRFVPRRLRTNLGGDWSLKQWMRSREYQALCTTLLALAALKLWWAI